MVTSEKILIEVKNVSLDYKLNLGGRSLRERLVSKFANDKFSQRDISCVNALNDISFNLKHGDRLAIFGHNGAGKSTLLKLLAGLFYPDKGVVKTYGAVHSILTLGAGADQDLTGRENISRICTLYGLNKKKQQAVCDDVISFSELGAAIDRPLKTYSDGMKVRLLFSIYTSFEADILILDEAIGAGDVSFIEKAKRRTNEFYERSGAVIIATHSTELARSFCNRGMVLKRGHKEYEGDIESAISFYNKLAT